MKLYELSQNFNEIFNLLEDDEIPFSWEAMEDTLQAIEGDFEVKANNIAKMIKNLEAQAAGFDSEAKRLAVKTKALKNRVTNLKSYLQNNMQLIGKDKINTDIGAVCLQKSPPHIAVIDRNVIPGWAFNAPEPVLDSKYVMEVIKRGDDVPGVELQQGYHIRIR